MAYAEVDAAGRATCTFDITWQMPTPPAAVYGHLHAGSIAATLEPGGTPVVDAARRIRELGTTSYDPNIGPALMGTPAAVRGRVEDLIRLADVVKASDEDLAWLYGDELFKNGKQVERTQPIGRPTERRLINRSTGFD